MAKGMTKTQLIRFMAEKMEINNKQSAAFFTTLAETAVKETKSPIGRKPHPRAANKIKAKTVVKFRIAKAAKDTIAPPKK